MNPVTVLNYGINISRRQGLFREGRSEGLEQSERRAVGESDRRERRPRVQNYEPTNLKQHIRPGLQGEPAGLPFRVQHVEAQDSGDRVNAAVV
ncbi:MAG TPA: hypothetical protein VJ951_13830 [Bacteroidales bacterium]|nr:hypothetical protein [Bacteroidales bacterium]